MTDCSIKDCDKPVKALGYCWKHYQRNRRHGNPKTVFKTGRKPKERYMPLESEPK